MPSPPAAADPAPPAPQGIPVTSSSPAAVREFEIGRTLLDGVRDYEAAVRILREAVATSPVDPSAFGYLADASERLSHFGQTASMYSASSSKE